MTLVILRRKRGYYWRLVAKNGRIVAVGGEPFARASAARKAFASMVAGARLGVYEWRCGRLEVVGAR